MVASEDAEVPVVGGNLPAPEKQGDSAINVAQAHDLATQTQAFLQHWSANATSEKSTAQSNWTNALTSDEKRVWTLATQQGHIKKLDPPMDVVTPVELLVFSINDRYWASNPDATSDILIEEHDRWTLNYVYP